MKYKFISSALFVVFLFNNNTINAQGVGINPGGNPPDNSAGLDVNFNNKGVLMPRMTTSQRNSISTPATGLMIYNTDCNELQFYNSISWITMSLLTPLVATAGSAATSTQITANWTAGPGATGYFLDVATDAAFLAMVSGYNNLSVGNVLTYNVTGLTCGTTYYYRLRAANSCGRGANSNTISYVTASCFTCGTNVTDSRDSKVYNTVQIGTQCWMKQNMDYGTRINGSVVQSNNNAPEKYCYSNLDANCSVYGGIYLWAEAVQYFNTASNTTSWSPVPTGNVQGICPAGWHIPTDAEFSTLETFLGGSSVAGGKMKETGTAHWQTPNTGADNSSGFTAVAGGGVNSAGTYFNSPYDAYFWMATEQTPGDAWYRNLTYNNTIFYRGAYTKNGQGMSIRCLKD